MSAVREQMRSAFASSSDGETRRYGDILEAFQSLVAEFSEEVVVAEWVIEECSEGTRRDGAADLRFRLWTPSFDDSPFGRAVVWSTGVWH